MAAGLTAIVPVIHRAAKSEAVTAPEIRLYIRTSRGTVGQERERNYGCEPGSIETVIANPRIDTDVSRSNSWGASLWRKTCNGCSQPFADSIGIQGNAK